MSKRKPYTRPIANNWWTKNPFYLRYMIREGTVLLTGLYALLLTFGVAALAKSEAAWNGWLQLMHNPLMVCFHILALIATMYHIRTWFSMAPKAFHLQFGEKKVEDKVLTAAQYAAFAIFTVFVLALAIWGGM